MSKTFVAGYIPGMAKKVTGEGYTAEKVLGRDEIYKKLNAKRTELYSAYGNESEYKKIEEEYDKIYESLNTAQLTSGFLITFDDIETCDIVCQAWEHDDAITCVSFGYGKNIILVTTRDSEGKYVPKTFSFIAAEGGQSKVEY